MGTYKKLRWENADVRCPFYIAHSQETPGLRCEGYDAGVDFVSRFHSLALMDRHMGRYCVGRFEDCPVYRCTCASKYADR